MKISLNILSQRAVKICESRQTDACMSSYSKGRVINRHTYAFRWLIALCGGRPKPFVKAYT